MTDRQDAHQPRQEAQQGAALARAVLASHTRREWLHWQPDDDGTGLEQYRRIGCAVCGEDWDAEGCSAVLLARRATLLEGLLGEVMDAFEPPREVVIAEPYLLDLARRVHAALADGRDQGGRG